ncbi:MAG: IS110 family transposase [Solirubrobacterales bacterium]|nr:IS110 family transposase [Solirubrobacterales bacterium]
MIAAPGKIERPAQDRVKTDRRDAERLVRLVMIDGLHAVRVPTLEEESLRDLVRAREDLRGDLMRARHRMGKLLLRHDVRASRARAIPGRTVTAQWLSMVRLPERGAQAALLDYLGAFDALHIRGDQLEATIAGLVPTSLWAQAVARLRCLRGIDTLSAVGLCAEIHGFERFEHPTRLMSYVGLVPSENSSGERRRQGAITKSGSKHARRLLVEAAWHYRHPPRLGTRLKARQVNQPATVIATAWKAQQRLHQTWRRLQSRGKRNTIIIVAVAASSPGSAGRSSSKTGRHRAHERSLGDRGQRRASVRNARRRTPAAAGACAAVRRRAARRVLRPAARPGPRARPLQLPALRLAPPASVEPSHRRWVACVLVANTRSPPSLAASPEFLSARVSRG